MVSGDVDGDGDNDVFGGDFVNGFYWFENLDGLGGFSSERSISTLATGGAMNIIMADIDGDGDLDIISAAQTANQIVWHENISGAIDILTFSVPGETLPAYFDAVNHIIAIKVPVGTDLTNLVATFTLSTGATVKVGASTQASGATPNDFTNPVTYTVTAEDGSTAQDWTVKLATPFITSIQPTSAIPGKEVTIYGIFFDAVLANNTVTFDGALATINSGTANSLNVTVPVTTSGPAELIVTTVFGSSDLLTNFTIVATDQGGTFSDPVTYQVSNGPSSVISADFNNDGYYDVAIAGNDQISILLGDGSGSFGTATTYTDVGAPQSLTSGDFNQDGYLDIATGNRNGNNIGVLLSDGTGSFGQVSYYSVGADPRDITSGDYNSDGILDLVTTNNTSDNVSVLLGDGLGSFGSETTFNWGNNPGRIVSVDFNNDNLLDLAISHSTIAEVSILLGDGSGSFGTPTNFPVDGWGNINSGDFNNDGNSDLVLGIFVTNNLNILLGDGTGAFGTLTNFLIGNNPFKVVASDLNGDGNIDLAAANNNDNNVSLLFGDGLGSFAAAINYSTGMQSRSVSSADFDGDGDLDLAVANNGDNNISILTNLNIATDLLTFTFQEETGPAVIDDINHTIDIEVAFGTDVTSLIASFTLSTAATAKISAISQSSGVTSNDFSNSVVYDITAEDGTTIQPWTVNVAIDDGLVAYYPFSGNVNDESGNGNNGVENGGLL